MTDSKQWRDDQGRYFIADSFAGYGFDFQSDNGARERLTEGDARFLLRVLPEALGKPALRILVEAITKLVDAPASDEGGTCSMCCCAGWHGCMGWRHAWNCPQGEDEAKGCTCFLEFRKKNRLKARTLERAIVEAAELYATMYESCACKVADCDCEAFARKLREAVRAEREALKEQG